MKMHWYFLLNITGPHSCIGGAGQIQLWGPPGRLGARGLSEAQGGLQLSSAGTDDLREIRTNNEPYFTVMAWSIQYEWLFSWHVIIAIGLRLLKWLVKLSPCSAACCDILNFVQIFTFVDCILFVSVLWWMQNMAQTIPQPLDQAISADPLVGLRQTDSKLRHSLLSSKADIYITVQYTRKCRREYK